MTTYPTSLAVFVVALAAFLCTSAHGQTSAGTPVSIPLKVWVVGEVSSTDLGGSEWRMSLSGDFAPMTPGAGTVTEAVSRGTDPAIVERMVTLNGVPCEPFREYSVSFTSQGFWSGRFCVAAPPGYRVEIDYKPRNSVLFDNTGGAIIWDAHPTVRVVPLSSLPPRPAGTPTSLSVGLMDWRVSLGALRDGSSAGEIGIRSPAWDTSWAALLSPACIEYTGSATDEVIDSGFVPFGAGFRKQYFANETAVDIVPVSATSFEIRFYHPSQFSGSTYPRTVSGDPFVTYRIEPGSSSTSLRITRAIRDVTDVTTAGRLPSRVELTSLSRAGSWPSFTWTASDWTLQNGITATEIIERDSGSGTERTANFKVQAPNGPTSVVDVTSNYSRRAWGEALTSTTVNAGTESLTTNITYGNDTSDTWFCQYGYPLRQTFPDGSWESYTYSAVSTPADRNRAGVVIAINRPWKNAPTQPSDSYDQGEQTSFGYFDDVFGFPTRPSAIVTRVNGTITRRTFINYTNGGVLGGTSLPLLVATRREYASDTTYLESVVRYFREDTSDPFYHKKTHSVQRADGTKTAYVYQRGYWSGTSFTATANAGTSTSFDPAESSTGPIGSRIIAIRGTASSGDSYTAHGGYDIDDVRLVDGKSTMEVTLRDERALTRRLETHVWKAGAWELIASVDFEYDFVGRLISRKSSNGDTEDYGYTAGYRSSEVDASGRELQFTYDDAGRLRDRIHTSHGTMPALTTRFSYDPAGRVVSEEWGYGGSESITSSWTYDAAGRLKSSSQAGQGTTTYAYDTTSRSRTITLPNGGTRTESQSLDGRLESVSGTAAVSQSFSRNLDSAGMAYVRTNLGSADSARKNETWFDWLGRPIKSSRPSFGTNPEYIEEPTYHASTGLMIALRRSDLAPLLYSYDDMAQLSRSGVDVNGSGILENTSADRIAELSTAYEKDSQGIWWLCQTSTTYPFNDTGSPIVVRKEQTRLTSFGGSVAGVPGVLRSEHRTTDANGLTTIVQRLVDRSTKSARIVTTLPGVTPKQVQTFTNGVETALTRFDMLVETQEYDRLLRPTKRTYPRTGPILVTYHFGTWLVSAQKNPVATVRTFGYDSAGRVVTADDAAGRRTSFQYDYFNRVIRQWGSGAHPVEFGYNALGEQTSQISFRSGTSWSNSAWPDTTALPADRTTWDYDAGTGLISSKTDPLGRTTRFTYDRGGRLLTRVWARGGGVSTSFRYDSGTGDLLSKTYSDGTPAVSYTYTRSGQVKTVNSGAAGTWTYVYNAELPHQLDETRYGAFYGDRVLARRYSNVKQDTGFQLGDASRGPAADMLQVQSYDGSGRMAGLSFTQAGQPERNYIYSFNNGGRAALITAMFTPFRVSYTFEPNRDLLTQIATQWADGKALQLDQTFNALGQCETTRQSGTIFNDLGTSTYRRYSYNERGELLNSAEYLGTDASSTSAPQLSGRHILSAYDAAGNRVSYNRTGSAGTADSFSVDAANQLVTRTNPFAHAAGTVANDTIAVTVSDSIGPMPVGRQGPYWYAQLSLDNLAGPKADAVTVTATASLADGTSRARTESRPLFLPRFNQPYSYDADGNLVDDGVWKYEWDAENRLVAMETSPEVLSTTTAAQARRLEFSYDYRGRRIQKRVRGGWNGSWYSTILSERRYLYNGWNIVAEFSVAPAGGLSLLRTYAWGLDRTDSRFRTGGVAALLHLTDHRLGTTYYATHDVSGNLVALLRATDGAIAAKYEYTPFGDVLRSEGEYARENPIRYSTKFSDEETGLVYFGYRYYDPRNGRFISRDPVGEPGGMNLYGFAGNDPVNRWDYLGLKEESSDDPTGPWWPPLFSLPGFMRDPSPAPTSPPYKVPQRYEADDNGNQRVASSEEPSLKELRGTYTVRTLFEDSFAGQTSAGLAVTEGLPGSIRSISTSGTALGTLSRLNPIAFVLALLAPTTANSPDVRTYPLIRIEEGYVIPENADPSIVAEFLRVRQSDKLKAKQLLLEIWNNYDIHKAVPTAIFFPRGFDNREQFEHAMRDLLSALRESNIQDAVVGVRGSSITGVSSNPRSPSFGRLFGPASDIDAFVISSQISTLFGGDRFVHPDDLLPSFPALERWAQKWTRILGREISPAAWKPGALPNSPNILLK